MNTLAKKDEFFIKEAIEINEHHIADYCVQEQSTKFSDRMAYEISFKKNKTCEFIIQQNKQLGEEQVDQFLHDLLSRQVLTQILENILKKTIKALKELNKKPRQPKIRILYITVAETDYDVIKLLKKYNFFLTPIDETVKLEKIQDANNLLVNPVFYQIVVTEDNAIANAKNINLYSKK